MDPPEIDIPMAALCLSEVSEDAHEIVIKYLMLMFVNGCLY